MERILGLRVPSLERVTVGRKLGTDDVWLGQSETTSAVMTAEEDAVWAGIIGWPTISDGVDAAKGRSVAADANLDGQGSTWVGTIGWPIISNEVNVSSDRVFHRNKLFLLQRITVQYVSKCSIRLMTVFKIK